MDRDIAEAAPTPSGKKKPGMGKLAAALVALTAPVSFVTSCTSSFAEDSGSGGRVISVSQAQTVTVCKCFADGDATTINCPPNDTCGSWLCDPLEKACGAQCKFDPKTKEGEKCETFAGTEGVCASAAEPFKGLSCCGCFDPETKACKPGNAVNACGVGGNDCRVCEPKTCAVAVCSAGKCGYDTKPLEETTCDDGDACTGQGKCNGGNCKAEPINCSDGDPCTTDPCDPASGCTAHGNVPNNPPVACNDGNFCTGPASSDKCVDGDCEGELVVCNDLNPCTTDTCSEAEDKCIFTSLPEGTTGCDDGSACTSNDRCQDHDDDDATPRICIGDGALCNGGNPCLDPNCDEANDECPAMPAPINEGGACSTGSPCLVDETCQSGVCTGGTDLCDDGNPCTVDACTPSGCQYVPASGQCDDGNPCTENDSCSDGACEGTEITCEAIDSCHGAGNCDEDTGTCSDPRLPDGTVCDTTGECDNGVCIGGTLVTPGEGGAGGEGTGGDDATGGTAGETGSGATGPSSGGNGSGGSSGGTDDPNLQGGIFARDPGGCACSVPGASDGPARTGTLAFLLTAVAGLFRRRRKAA